MTGPDKMTEGRALRVSVRLAFVAKIKSLPHVGVPLATITDQHSSLL